MNLRTRGFTLVEMLVSLTILVILLGMAMPSFRAFILDNRLNAQARELVSAVQIARSEAARLNTSVVLCPSADQVACGTDWTSPQILFADVDNSRTVSASEQLILVGDAVPANSTITGPSAGWIRINSSGQINAPAKFVICDQRSGLYGREVDFSGTGRATITTANCP